MEIAHEMTIAEIDEVIEAHVISARHVQQAGMDGVEIHAAHGYLPQQFLSPVTNHRSDEYGGSLENRMRFLQRLIVAVRDEVGADYPLGLRISGDEFSEGGMDLPAMREVAAIIAAEGKIDYMSVSHSNYQSGASYATMVPDMHYPAAPFVHIAAGIKEVVGGLPTIAVGRIITPADAEGVLNKGQADMVGMTRAHIADPEIAGKMRDGRDDDIRLCLSCNQGCVAMTHSGQSLTCVVNPAVGLEAEFGREAIRTADKSKRVIVVGGGPAGMEAACVAAGRGHDVVLLEKDTALGGQFNLAVKQPGRSDLGRLTAHLTHQLEKLEVDVRLGANATAESILELKPDAVIIATGSSPAPITIPAEDSGIKTASVADILNGTVQPGERVLLLDNDGHFKAAATSQLLADQGLEVFHVTPRGTLGPEIPGISQHGVNKRLRDKKVDVRVSTGVRRIAKNDAVVFNTYSGVEETIPNIDTIVVAAAGVANNALHKALIGKVESLHIAGDAMAPRRALEAMSEGHRAGNAV